MDNPDQEGTRAPGHRNDFPAVIHLIDTIDNLIDTIDTVELTALSKWSTTNEPRSLG